MMFALGQMIAFMWSLGIKQDPAHYVPLALAMLMTAEREETE